MSQLDLFRDFAAPAIVYAFPLARRRDLITAAVDALNTRDRKSGEKWWRSHLRDLRKDLRSQRIPTREISDLIGDYAGAVRNEMLRADGRLEAGPPHGGAA